MNTPPPPHDTLPTLAPDDEPPAIDSYALLKPQHQRVIDHLVAGMNQTQAYIAAGYLPQSAAVCASQLLSTPNMQAALEQKRSEAARAAAMTRDSFVASLKRDTAYDLVEAYRDGTLRLKPLSEWPAELRKCVVGIEVTERTTEHGTSTTAKVRFLDRLKAKELMGRAMGYFTQVEDGSKFELHINLSQAQVQVQAQGQAVPEMEPHDYGPLRVHLPKQAPPPAGQELG